MKDRIKELRNFFGLTQEEFSKRLGVARNSIASYEIGRREPTNAMISLICREFGISENWLRTGEGEMIEPINEDEAFWAHFGELTKGDEEFMKELIMFMYNASPDERKMFKKMVKGLAARDDIKK